MLLIETLNRAESLFSHKEGIVCGDKRYSYREFRCRVNRLSNFLLGKGCKKGTTISILHPNCHFFLEAYYACAQIGAILNPLNFRLSQRELSFIMEDAETKILLAHKMFSPIVDALRRDFYFKQKVIWTGMGYDGKTYDMDYEKILEESFLKSPQEVELYPEDLAQLYYTSGTTGRPKGVMLSHKNVYLHALGAIAELHLTDRDVWIHAAPLFHLADAWATFAITWVGGRHVLVEKFEPTAILEAIQRERVTITNLIPTMLNLLVKHPKVKDYDCSSLRVLLSGGAPIAPELVRKIMETFPCDYIQTYGMTETSPYLTMSILKEHLKGLPKERQLEFKSRTGRKFISINLKVVNERGEEVKLDNKEVGEIIVKGDTVTWGYWKLPEETKQAIKDGWLFTGDLAVIDEEGYVNIVDRRKDMIISGGENVYSTEVENILYTYPPILEAAVIGIPDEKWGEAVKAVVVLKDGHTASAEKIIKYCKDHLVSHLTNSLNKSSENRIV